MSQVWLTVCHRDCNFCRFFFCDRARSRAVCHRNVRRTAIGARPVFRAPWVFRVGPVRVQAGVYSYSYRKVTIGSTFRARRAGIKQASNVMKVTRAATEI